MRLPPAATARSHVDWASCAVSLVRTMSCSGRVTRHSENGRTDATMVPRLESKRVHDPSGKAGDPDRTRRSDGSCGRGRTRQHPGRVSDLSGFLGQFVGFVVGFLRLPDIHLISVINELKANCRVCRVFLGVESSSKFRANKKHQEATQTYRRWRIGWRPVLDSSWTPKGHLRRVV